MRIVPHVTKKPYIISEAFGFGSAINAGGDYRWRNRGGRMGPDPPLLFLGGPGPPLFSSAFFLVGVSNTIAIGSIVEVNRLMKIL